MTTLVMFSQAPDCLFYCPQYVACTRAHNPATTLCPVAMRKPASLAPRRGTSAANSRPVTYVLNRIDNHSHLRSNTPNRAKLLIMYVCLCKSVTDKQIRHAAASGVDNLYELRERLGVGAGCGTCASNAQDILNDSAAARGSPTLYTPSAA